MRAQPDAETVKDMAEAGAIPPLVAEVLKADRGYVLVVMGEPGAGKTLLAREIFRTFPESHLIITSSESVDEYRRSLQSTEEWERRCTIVDQPGQLTSDTLRSNDLDVLLGTISAAEGEAIESPTIIIDSLTHLLGDYPPALQEDIQRALTSAARSGNRRLVLVADNAQDDQLRATLLRAADGIVSLTRMREEDRAYRVMRIHKLRGATVDQDEFLFTLHGGRFKYIPWYRHRFPAITIGREPIRDASKRHVSTGSRGLDNLLHGGFQKGMVNLIEIDSMTSPYVETLYIPFLSNQLQLGRGVVVVLPEGWSQERLVRGLSYFVEREAVNNQMIFFGRHYVSSSSNVRTLDDDPQRTLQELRYEVHQLARRFGQDVTQFISLDTLENMYGSHDAAGMMAEMAASLAETSTTTVAVLTRHQEVLCSRVPHTVHIVVRQLCGVIALYGSNPRTGFLVLTPRLETGFLDYDLVPVV